MSRIGQTFTTTVAASPAAAVETVIATIGPLSPFNDGSPILLVWQFTIVIGTNGVGFNVRVRQGTTTSGTALYTPSGNQNLAAASGTFSGGMFIDTAAGADQQYALTVVALSATATSTISSLCFAAIAL